MDAFEREVEMIENDPYLSPTEKRRAMRELERDEYESARESAQSAYDNEMGRHGFFY